MEGNEETGKTGLLEKLALVKLNGRGGSTRDQNGLEEICMEKFNASLCHLRSTRKQEMHSAKEIVAVQLWSLRNRGCRDATFHERNVFVHFKIF